MGWGIEMNGNRVTGLPDPVNDTDAVPLGYVNSCSDKSLSSDGWYRVGLLSPNEGGSTAAAMITIGGLYRNRNPDCFVFYVTSTWNTAHIQQVAECTTTQEPPIDEIRMHQASDDRSQNYIDVHFNVTARNEVRVNVQQLQGVFTPYQLEAVNVSGLTVVSSIVVPEYDNPPLIVGKEYRTAERREGKPVYAYLFNFGPVYNNGEKIVEKAMPAGLHMVSIDAIARGTHLFQINPTGHRGFDYIYYYAHNGNVGIRTTSAEDTSAYTDLHILFKYTK